LKSKQLGDLKTSVNSETELWKKNLVKNDRCRIGPKYILEKFGLPNPQPGVQKPKWVHNRRKFLESLRYQERNILLMGDPFLEFDPCTFVLIYSYKPKPSSKIPSNSTSLASHCATTFKVLVQVQTLFFLPLQISVQNLLHLHFL
jgi:hypothetical protein